MKPERWQKMLTRREPRRNGGTMKERKLAIFFPGGKYGTQAPLFYYADLVMAEKGYEVIEISYADLAAGSGDWINQTREQIWGRLRQIDFSAYSEVVLVAKSIGTVLAGWIREKIARDAKMIFLTPLRGAFPYMDPENSMVIAGTLDRLLSGEELAEYCKAHGVCLHQFEGAGHAIVDRKDPVRSAEILTEIVRLYEAFIPGR